jgi:hypothetical protein
MADDIPPPYVALASPTCWIIKAVTADLHDDLISLGMHATEDEARFETLRDTAMSFEVMAQIAQRLCELGIAFSGGRDWSPSEVFRHLRDSKLIDGSFTEIAWTAPGKWSVKSL